MESYRIENMKPIKDSGKIEIRPITVFTGMDRCGISTLLRFPALLVQAFLMDKGSQLQTSGEFSEDSFTFSFTRPLDFTITHSGDENASPRVTRKNVTCRVTVNKNGQQALVEQTELFVEDMLLYRIRSAADGQYTYTVLGQVRNGTFEKHEHSFTGKCNEHGIFMSSGSPFLCRMAWSLVPEAEEDGDDTVYTSEAEARAAAGITGRVMSFLAGNGSEVVPHYMVESPAGQKAGWILGCFLAANNLLRKMEHRLANNLQGMVIIGASPANPEVSSQLIRDCTSAYSGGAFYEPDDPGEGLCCTKTVILAQPELNPDPASQARLADLLAEAVTADTYGGLHLLAEAHSEYFIRRLQALIADKNCRFTGDMVKIYSVDPDAEGVSRVKELKLSDNDERLGNDQ